MRFDLEGQRIQIFSAKISDLARRNLFNLVDVTSRNPKFITFIFEVEIDGEIVEFEASYMHENTLDQINVLNESQADLFYDNFNHEDFEQVHIS